MDLTVLDDVAVMRRIDDARDESISALLRLQVSFETAERKAAREAGIAFGATR